MQDLPTRKLLCLECEQRFSVLERAFSQKYFAELQSDSFRELKYEADLYQFSLSLSWRCLVCERDKLVRDFPRHQVHVDDALERWRLYLLGKYRRAHSETHLFVLAGIPVSGPTDAHPKTLHYMLRSVDATTVFSETSVAVYAKLLRSVFFTPITPKVANGWRNTRVHPDGGKLISPQSLLNPRFGSFLASRVEGAFEHSISEKQADRIDDAMRNNPDKVVRSESLRVMLATRGLEIDK
jgi:hypothetical protein